jgi:hypothetical protein
VTKFGPVALQEQFEIMTTIMAAAAAAIRKFCHPDSRRLDRDNTAF